MVEIGQCDWQLWVWIDTADRQRQEKMSTNSVREIRNLWVACVYMYLKLRDWQYQSVYNTGLTSGRNLKDLLCIYGGRLASETWCIPCALCFLKLILALYCHIFNSCQRQFFVQVFLEISIHQKKKCSKLDIDSWRKDVGSAVEYLWKKSFRDKPVGQASSPMELK